MFTVIKKWSQRYLSDPQAILLLILLGSSLLLILWMGKVLAPVIASIVIAYLLQWLANKLRIWKVPRLAAVLLVYMAFLGIFLSAILILWPIIWDQLTRLFEEFPSMITSFQHYLYLLPQQFPEYLTKETIDGWVASFLLQLKLSGKTLFAISLASVPSVIALIVYLFLVPLMVFFLLKDYPLILSWFKGFLPKDRKFLSTIGQNVHQQIGNYILGKVAEVFIVGLSTFLAFYFFNMRYATLLAVMVGLSVLIPYIGAVIVTIPVILVAFFQWGIGQEFAYLLIAYAVIQAIDGVILVPLLFAEAVNLHPLAIIIAILIFGGWWGFWGVFFAIPLATLVKAIIEAWPTRPLGRVS
ncbi:MAG: AI-2E family transporter [Proteobacteria bacterium]|nr:AI-2E family transporter [Pseudomonadota bacterium]